MKTQEKDLTAEIKQLAGDLRMDLVGIADPERYHSAPRMVRPKAHLPNAKAVVAFAIRYPYAMFDRAGKEPASSMMSMEIYQNVTIGRLLSKASMKIARRLEDRGYEAKPMTVSGKWRIHPYKDTPTDWCADFSNRHAAVAAGLGEFGLHALIITPEFGMKQRFCSVITDAPLTPDPMYSGPPLCDKCMACVKVCPVKAIDKDTPETLTMGDRTFEYATVDHWRCAWSEQTNMIAEEGPKYFGQKKSFYPPKEGPISDEQILQTFYTKCNEVGLQAGMTHAMGACMRVCTPPHLRGKKKHPVEHLGAAPY
ncbi:epoxyqueuosine reductase [PVC group bacterium]|nr:epoxyqueuosine reductase [PVC group bacterium]